MAVLNSGFFLFYLQLKTKNLPVPIEDNRNSPSLVFTSIFVFGLQDQQAH